MSSAYYFEARNSQKSNTGLFITATGNDGAGKTTAISHLNDYIEKHYAVPVIRTREPGGTAISEKIRELVLDPDNTDITANTELMLMYAARCQHVEQLIKPSLNDGKIILSDRWADDSFSYQGAGRGMDTFHIQDLHNWVLDGFNPDLSLIFVIDPEEGLKRAGKRSKADRFEQEELDFHYRIYEYLKSLPEHAERYQLIDASQSEENVARQVIEAFELSLTGSCILKHRKESNPVLDSYMSLAINS